MATKARSVDEYLASASADKREALQRLRSAIARAVPDALECIAYGLPSFRLDGKYFVSFGAAARHCAFYAGAHPIRTYAEELASYDTAKGTIRFDAKRPLPDDLVEKLVRARVEEFRRSRD
jgi:uncharacterized protein YdhG (YjbR/CyaY superfamily)